MCCVKFGMDEDDHLSNEIYPWIAWRNFRLYYLIPHWVWVFVFFCLQFMNFKVPVSLLRYFLQLQLSSLIYFTINYSRLGMCDVRHFGLPDYPSCSPVPSNLFTLDEYVRDPPARPCGSKRLRPIFQSWTYSSRHDCQPRGLLISTRALFFSPMIFLVLSLGVFVLVVHQSITDPPFARSG